MRSARKRRKGDAVGDRRPLPPGADLVERGLADLRAGRTTIHALLVSVGAPRLRALGLRVPTRRHRDPPEHRLYDLLARRDPAGAHSRYNALVRRLVSFERALELELRLRSRRR